MPFRPSQKRITSAPVKRDVERLLGDGSVSVDSFVKTAWKPGYAKARALFHSGKKIRERGIEHLHSSLSSDQVVKTSTDKLGQLIEAGFERITTDLHERIRQTASGIWSTTIAEHYSSTKNRSVRKIVKRNVDYLINLTAWTPVSRLWCCMNPRRSRRERS